MNVVAFMLRQHQYWSCSVPQQKLAAPAAQQQTAQAQTDYLRWNYYTRTILPPPVVSDVTH